MKKLFPIALAMLGAFALFGFLFLLIRSEAMPARVRAFDWRRAKVAAPAAVVDEPAA